MTSGKAPPDLSNPKPVVDEDPSATTTSVLPACSCGASQRSAERHSLFESETGIHGSCGSSLTLRVAGCNADKQDREEPNQIAMATGLGHAHFQY